MSNTEAHLRLDEARDLIERFRPDLLLPILRYLHSALEALAAAPPPASAAPGWVLTGTYANEERYLNLGVGRWTGANYWQPTVANPRALLHIHSPEGVTVLHDDEAAPARATIRALAGLPA